MDASGKDFILSRCYPCKIGPSIEENLYSGVKSQEDPVTLRMRMAKRIQSPSMGADMRRWELCGRTQYTAAAHDKRDHNNNHSNDIENHQPLMFRGIVLHTPRSRSCSGDQGDGYRHH